VLFRSIAANPANFLVRASDPTAFQISEQGWVDYSENYKQQLRHTLDKTYIDIADKFLHEQVPGKVQTSGTHMESIKGICDEYYNKDTLNSYDLDIFIGLKIILANTEFNENGMIKETDVSKLIIPLIFDKIKNYTSVYAQFYKSLLIVINGWAIEALDPLDLHLTLNDMNFYLDPDTTVDHAGLQAQVELFKGSNMREYLNDVILSEFLIVDSTKVLFESMDYLTETTGDITNTNMLHDYTMHVHHVVTSTRYIKELMGAQFQQSLKLYISKQTPTPLQFEWYIRGTDMNFPLDDVHGEHINTHTPKHTAMIQKIQTLGVFYIDKNIITDQLLINTIQNMIPMYITNFNVIVKKVLEFKAAFYKQYTNIQTLSIWLTLLVRLYIRLLHRICMYSINTLFPPGNADISNDNFLAKYTAQVTDENRPEVIEVIFGSIISDITKVDNAILTDYVVDNLKLAEAGVKNIIQVVAMVNARLDAWDATVNFIFECPIKVGNAENNRRILMSIFQLTNPFMGINLAEFLEDVVIGSSNDINDTQNNNIVLFVLFYYVGPYTYKLLSERGFTRMLALYTAIGN